METPVAGDEFVNANSREGSLTNSRIVVTLNLTEITIIRANVCSRIRHNFFLLIQAIFKNSGTIH